MTMTILLILFGFLFGSALGSFLNVVALRTVTGTAWWGKERSRCPKCGATLEPRDLIPLASWFFLRGKCRTCGSAIPFLYLAAEIATGTVTAVLLWRWGVPFGVHTLLALGLGTFMLLNSFTDLYEGYIYDYFALAPVGLGLGLRLFGGVPGFLDGLGGAALGYGVIAGIILLTKLLMKQEGMGWGDAHLMAGAGAVLGWKFVALALYLGFMLGGIVIVPLFLLKKVQRKDAIPLGPFLALGSILTLVAGPQILGLLYFASSWPW